MTATPAAARLRMRVVNILACSAGACISMLLQAGCLVLMVVRKHLAHSGVQLLLPPTQLHLFGVLQAVDAEASGQCQLQACHVSDLRSLRLRGGLRRGTERQR